MAELRGWTVFFGELTSFLEDLDRSSGTSSEAYAEYVLERIPVCLRVIRQIMTVLRGSTTHTEDEEDTIAHYTEELSSLFEALIALSKEWEDRLDDIVANESNSSYSYRAPVVRVEGAQGRPRFDIKESQLEYLASLSFSWTQIASLLQVSRMTIYRRRVEFNLMEVGTVIRNYSDLKAIVRQMKIDSPHMGEVLLMGRLRASGYRASRKNLRAAIRDLDPLNTALRVPGGLAPRRPYHVASPNSLWHIDGHHKLVRWGFVTHAGIDGYSRMIVFMNCSTNNKAETVYDLFLQGVQKFGLPSRVRTDQGGENIKVAHHMLVHRGSERSSIITGNSTHNQRIERLWRDLHQGVTQLFYRLFYHLEHLELLDPTCEIDLYALQYVFLPRINKAIKEFAGGWNSHGIRTEHNKSPYQLFTEGALRLQRTGLHALDFFQNVDESYGSEADDDYTYSTLSDHENRVRIPPNTFSLDEDAYTRLSELINPLSESSNYGIELYEQTLQFIMYTLDV